MRLDGPEFTISNKATQKEPIFVVALSFDLLNTDVHYLTSQPVTGLTGNIINHTLKMVSSTSQTLNPDKANSTIGSIKFECLDIGLTALQRAKLSDDKGLNGKRVRVYQGYRGLLWTQYQLIQTQIISGSIAYKDGVYTFNCADIQRAMRKDVFNVKETRLIETLEPTATEMEVADTTGFEVVYQVPSAANRTLLRGLQAQLNDDLSPKYPTLVGVDEIGILRLEGGDDFEMVIWTGKTQQLPFRFTGLIRGVLGTRPLRIEVDASGDQDKQPKVTEYAYLSMPAVKAAYALLTGSIYGHAGKFLPDHWHLGISTDYVKTSAFVNIGADLWNVADDDAGFPIDIRGAEKQDGKQFIEEKIYYMVGLYSPITVQGELSLRRMSNVSATGGDVRLLNEDNIVSYSELTHDLKSVVNSFVLKWNWDERREKFTRTDILLDPQSIARHGKQEPKVVELETLHGSRHSDNRIKKHFDALRSRYAGPPLRMSLELTPDQNDLEVGDIVRVSLLEIQDFSNSPAGPINRNFEIQSVSNDWVNGNVRVTLFGSSELASDIPPDRTETIPEAFYTGLPENEINSTNFPGMVTSTGGITSITGNISLVGSDDLNDEECVYWCGEDLTLNGGVTITITKNVQIRVNGFFQQNGSIDGAGNGHPGGVSDSVPEHLWTPSIENLGIAGIGVSRAQGGFYLPSTQTLSAGGGNVRQIVGDTLPSSLLLELDGVELIGLPSTLIGTSGSSGGGVLWNDSGYFSRAEGGDGGASGAGLVIAAKGIDIGIVGTIDLSGEDGQPGTPVSYPVIGNLVKSGAGGGGCPGGLILILTESSRTHPIVNDVTVQQYGGLCPQGENIAVGPVYNLNHFYRTEKGEYKPNLPISNGQDGGGTYLLAENQNASHTIKVFLNGRSTPEEDEPPYVENDPTFTLTEYLNTPVTPDGDQSTIEVSVTPPADTNYAYALVDYRRVGETGWQTTTASNEALIVVPSNGWTYEIQVRAVSTQNNATPSGPIQTITVTNVNGMTDEELAAVYPFEAITGLSLQNETGDIFTGRDAAFEWSHDNAALIYFSHYAIEMYSGATLLRTERSGSPFYIYSLEKNALDFRRLNGGTDGIYWELEIRVKAVSRYLNDADDWYAGDEVSFEVTAPVVSAPDVSLAYSGSNVVLTWPGYANSFLTITTTLEYSGNVIMETTGNSFTVPVDWTGSRTFNVRAAHLPTHGSAVTEVIVNPAAPSLPVVSAQVIANSILFDYRSTAGSLPIDRYEIRRGGTYDSGQTPDIKAGTSSFTIYNETAAATIVFWFEAVDTAGNHSGYVSVSVSVSSPPNYQLLATYSAKNANWPGTKTNALVTEQNNLLVPVNTTETYQQHFDNNSWATPQDQVTAGFEYFIQPSTNTAQYVVTYDYGSEIDNAIISATTAPVVFDGSVTAQVTIAHSPDNSTWTSGTAGATQIMGEDFRYVRVTIDFTASGGDDLAFVEDVLIKLDKQIDEDFGIFTADSSDTNGTFVAFNKDFIDANTPTVTINTGSISGSTASSPIRAEAVIRFVDEPDPTGFYVYVFNAANGNRVTASGSWHAYGFTRT